jgi:Flp pilus assembly protein TadG
MRRQSAQALVEWAISALVLILFAFGLLAVGHVVGEYMAVRSAASQAAFAAARAPSAQDAQTAGQEAARQVVASSQVSDFHLTIDTAGFQRGGTLTADATGCVSLDPFQPLITDLLGRCVQLRWVTHALIEPYRSRAA